MTDQRNDFTQSNPASPFYSTIALGAGLYALNYTGGTWTPRATGLIEVRAVLHRSAATDSGAFWIVGTFRSDVAGTIVQVGSTQVIHQALDADLAGSQLLFDSAGQLQYHHASANAYVLHYTVYQNVIFEVT